LEPGRKLRSEVPAPSLRRNSEGRIPRVTNQEKDGEIRGINLLVGLPTRSVGPTDRSAGLLVGRTHLSGTAMSLVGGDPGVPMSHSPRTHI
jgi:hypothetical protein